MKILVIGDTHGKLNKVRDIYEKLKNVDLILHTGDHITDGIDFGSEVHVPTVCVKGNCDGSMSRDDYEIVKCECGNILLTHGHMQDVNYNTQRLLYLAEEHDCIAVIYGHTHVALIDEIDGIHFVNPGSLTQPRDGSDGTYAIVRTSDDSFEASIVYYSTVMDTGRKRTQTGYIRSLIQYSDRF
ncbi:MAG: metallophosphoesterase [Bacillota bacterium]|nr:metallophosphoesterase [Bacillota bacterium]